MVNDLVMDLEALFKVIVNVIEAVFEKNENEVVVTKENIKEAQNQIVLDVDNKEVIKTIHGIDEKIVKVYLLVVRTNEGIENQAFVKTGTFTDHVNFP